MKRKISFCLAFLMIFSTLTLCAQAYPHDYELEAFEGLAFVKKELWAETTEKLDMTAFEGEGPFDFFGVSIVEIEDTSAGIGSESGYYHIKLAPEVDSAEAKKHLEACDGIELVGFNGISYPDEDPKTVRYPDISKSPFIEKSAEELKALHAFAPDEFKLYLNHELDLTEFEGEGKHYLFGVCIDTISALEQTEASVFGYEIKLGKQYMWNSTAIWVFECNESVVSVEYKSTYGNGDINSDEKIDNYDYVLAKRMYFNTYIPRYDELGYADVNLDGRVNEYDYILLCRHYFGTYTIG